MLQTSKGVSDIGHMNTYQTNIFVSGVWTKTRNRNHESEPLNLRLYFDLLCYGVCGGGLKGVWI